MSTYVCFRCQQARTDCVEFTCEGLDRDGNYLPKIQATMCTDCMLEFTDDAKQVTFLYPGGGFVIEVVDDPN